MTESLSTGPPGGGRGAAAPAASAGWFGIVRALVRLVAGTLAAALAGYLAFGLFVFRFTHPASQCVLLGALAAAIWTAVRLQRYAVAVWLVVVFAAMHTGANLGRGAAGATAVAAWSLAIGFGLCVVGLVYDRLARAGFVFGKFLIIGPLVGGVYAATTPLASIAMAATGSGVPSVWLNTWLGIVLGDGAAFGLEAAELSLKRWEDARAGLVRPPHPGTGEDRGVNHSAAARGGHS